MNIQFNKFMPNKLVMCKDSGFTIPKKTSTVVTMDNIPKTNQILLVLETC